MNNTVSFKFKQTGVNAHTADGTFTYDTPEHAQQAAERLRKTQGYSNVTVGQLHRNVVLLQYDNCGPSVHIVTSKTPLTLDRIAAYFERVDGANWERDSLTILNKENGEVAELSIDRKSRK